MKKVKLILFIALITVAGVIGAKRMVPFVNPAQCVGCNDCIQICPVNGKNGKMAIEIINGQAVINPEDCISCGLCVNICSFEAVR